MTRIIVDDAAKAPSPTQIQNPELWELVVSYPFEVKLDSGEIVRIGELYRIRDDAWDYTKMCYIRPNNDIIYRSPEDEEVGGVSDDRPRVFRIDDKYLKTLRPSTDKPSEHGRLKFDRYWPNDWNGNFETRRLKMEKVYHDSRGIRIINADLLLEQLTNMKEKRYNEAFGKLGYNSAIDIDDLILMIEASVIPLELQVEVF